MDLVTPGIGLIFWTTMIFGILLLVLRKAAWKPISNAIDKRSQSIDDALKAAEKAREEMKNLKADNERILAEARTERDKMLIEARDMKEKIIGEAKAEANIEVQALMSRAKVEVENIKAAAIENIRNQVIDLSLAVAEKVLKAELKDYKRQEKLVEDLIKDANLN